MMSVVRFLRPLVQTISSIDYTHLLGAAQSQIGAIDRRRVKRQRDPRVVVEVVVVQGKDD